MKCARVWGVLLMVLIIFGFCGPVFALSAADFLPPVKGGSSEIEGEVTEVEGVIVAESAQDAFNFANQQLEFVQEKFKMVEFPSGIGFISGGSHIYRVHESYNATLLEKRQAYVFAYTKAKAELALGLRGLTGYGYDRLTENLDLVDTSVDTVVNFSDFYEERILQSTEALLRGYVIFDVRDDVENRTVYVTLATSHRTLEAVASVSGGLIQAADLAEGIDYVLDQVTLGVVPPVGGTVVRVPATGEIAVVSFGSEIIRRHDDPATEARLLQTAQRAAEMRSRDALIGIMTGDAVTWQSGLRTVTEFETQEYKEIRDIYGNLVEYRVLDDTKTTFISVMELTDDYQSIRAGNFPPGVTTRLYRDGSWYFAISVYIPSVTHQVEDFYELMKTAGRPARPGGPLSTDYVPGEEEAEEGPTGEVTPPGEL